MNTIKNKLRSSRPALVDYEILTNKKLSWCAKGIYSYLCIDEFDNCDIEELYSINIESKREIKEAIQELIDLGYLKEK
jgi:hypothetical protein